MKKIIALVLVCCVLLGLAACGPTEPAAVSDSPQPTAASQPSAVPEEPGYAPLPNGMSGDPADYDASVPTLEEMAAQVGDKFTQHVFEDASTGMSLDYNIFLPEGHGSGEKYPLVLFMSDASLVGKDVNAPVLKCRGAMVWALDSWQSEHPCIIAVPQFYNSGGNNGELAGNTNAETVRNLILMLSEEYDVDTGRIYGMGQSMGCMNTMYLDAKYDDLYTACLFVDGQWDINEITALKDRKFIYFAAEGDVRASEGMAEVKEMLSASSTPYSEVVWNAQDDQADLNAAALDMLAADNGVYFVSWLIGSVAGKPGQDAGMAAEHGYSFDFAYRQTALREWLFAQRRAPEERYELKVGAGVGAIKMDPSIFPTEGFSGTINDDPHVRVLLLEAGEKAAIVSCELSNASEKIIAGIIDMIAEKAGVPKENVWVHSTHALTTPHTPGNACVLAAAEEALDQAIASFAPASLGVGTIVCDMNVNRNIEVPEGISGGPYYGLGGTEYSNKTMTMLRFNGADGEPIAFFLSYGIKPAAIDMAGQKEGARVISSDVPGKACNLVEAEFGAPCIFCMPAAGDQYPKETTTYYTLNEVGDAMDQVVLSVSAGLEIMNRLGDEMGAKAIELASSIYCGVSETVVRGNSGSFEAEAYKSTADIPVSTLRLGNVAFVGFKPELDAQTEWELWRNSPFNNTLLISFMNGSDKYMPHAAGYDYNNGAGTFEVSRTVYGKGTAERLVDYAVELLNQTK